ncbi:sigma factor-like helix-turn-helix DNA-binding protein [Blautia sp. AF14-40]
MFFFQGLKQKEISDLLHIKLSLVKYRVSKAKELLSKQLEEGRD